MTQVPGQGSINYDLNDQIVGKSKNGNGDATDYGTFDETSRLTKAYMTPVGPGFTAGYLADGRRAWKQSNASGTTRFYYLYDGDRVIAELNANGNPTNAFGYGFAGLATRQESANPTRYHVYLYDPQGNAVERLTSTNGTNSYQVDYVGFYDAYGTQRSQISAQGDWNRRSQPVSDAGHGRASRGSSGHGQTTKRPTLTPAIPAFRSRYALPACGQASSTTTRRWRGHYRGKRIWRRRTCWGMRHWRTCMRLTRTRWGIRWAMCWQDLAAD